MSSSPIMLIVDDSRLSRTMIRAFAAATDPELAFIEAGDAEMALAVLAGGVSIDCATIDYNMPGTDGLTLAERIRERFPHAPIALLTANIQDSLRERAQAAGLRFVCKPITADKVSGAIAREVPA